MIRAEILVIAIGNIHGVFDSPDSTAFKTRNPLLLRDYRPEKKVDSDHYRVFSSIGGGIKAGVSDVLTKSSGKNHRLSTENTLKDLLVIYGIKDDRTCRRIIVFLQRALADESIYAGTKLSWLTETPEEKE